MSHKFTFTALAVALGLVASACSEQANPTSVSDTGITGVTTTSDMRRGGHHVTVGSADACEALGDPTGCDANFSLVAHQSGVSLGGAASGQWQDTFAGGGEGIHVAIDCLNVTKEGNVAIIGGEVTHGTVFGVDVSGLRAVAAVVDNGTSANDPPDQISFSVIFGVDCTALPLQFFIDNNLLLDLTHGQVRVQ